MSGLDPVFLVGDSDRPGRLLAWLLRREILLRA